MLVVLQKTGSHSAICMCSICKNEFTTTDRFFAESALAGDQCDTCKTLPNNPPSQLLLLQIYNYEADTGQLTYKRDFLRRKKGDIATTTREDGYQTVTLDKIYLTHRMIWLMQTGYLPEFIDHENHVRTDNRWANLRDVSRQVNAINKSLNTNNKSGYIGVSYMPARKKFRATITINRKSVHLGLFDTAELANQARVEASNSAGFHVNHGST